MHGDQKGSTDMITAKEREIIRDLAKKLADLAN